MADSMPRVLVCDDETFFREAIRDVLGEEQLEVVEAVDGETAIELASDPEVGVMILDIRLPGIDGIEVLRRVAADRPDLGVIMLSANHDEELVLDALRLGACDYLAKPLHDEELTLAVRRAVRTHAVTRDRGRLRSRIERLAVHIEGLDRAADEAAPGERREAIDEALVAAASDLLEAGGCELWREDDDPVEGPGVLRIVARHGGAEPMLGESAARAAFERAESFVVADAAGDDRLAAIDPDALPSSRSFAIAVLRGAGTAAGVGSEPSPGTVVEGVLCLAARPDADRLASDDLSLLRALAAHASALGSVAAAAEPVPPEASEPPPEPVDGDAELARAICDAITNEVAPEQLFQAALRPVEKQLDAAPLSLFLLDAESGGMVCEASCDGGQREDRDALPTGQGLTGSVLQTGRMVATDQPELDARFDAAVDTPLDGERGPLLCAPLCLRGKVVGVFRAFPRESAEASARSAEVIAAALSAAVRNALLYRSLLESIDEVAEARRTARS